MAPSSRTLGDVEREVALAGFLLSALLACVRLSGLAAIPWLWVVAPMWVPQAVRGLFLTAFLLLMWRWIG